MKFALVNGQRQEAQPNLSGKCPTHGHPMVARCGEVNRWHWAHQGSRRCDLWWENETAWHRAWKEQFPVDWQEVVQHAENGEKHVADVKTDHGWVIEFQHSYIKPEERRSRDTFYKRLVWVVDGARRKRDRTQLLNAFEQGVPVGPMGRNSPVRRAFSDECALLREWAGSPAPIFFDFGEEVLWWLLAKSPDGRVYVARFPRAQFIEIHRSGATQMARDSFDEFVKELSTSVANYELQLQAQTLQRASLQPLQGFERYLARRNRNRGRL
jgi:hypothetical protein